MMQLARQFSRLFTTKQPRAQQATHAQDVREYFREERAAITRPDTMPGDFFGAATAYLSDTLDSMNPFWPPDADFAGEIDGNFSAHQDHSFPQP